MKGKRLRRLNGAVLIMILTVMLVLIIMLMATLTVVTTASQRIYTKYEENQAYYSARSALDVFTQNMLYDKAYYAYDDSGNIKKFSHSDSSVASNKANMKQGLAMQLDLYKIKTKDTADTAVSTSIQNLLQNKFNAYAGTLDGTTGKEKKDEYLLNFGVVDIGGGKYDSSITYEVEFPQVSGQEKSGISHNYGVLADKRKAKITIEVLSREYDMGDDVLTSDTTTKVKDKIASFNGDQTQIAAFLSTPQNYEDTVKAVVNGSRKKDKIKIKITATTKVMGVEGTAVLICNSNEPPVNNSSRAITAFGGTGSDNMSILGGMSAEGKIEWNTNDGFIYGSVYIEDDFVGGSGGGGPKIHLSTGESVYVGGNLTLGNDNKFEFINESGLAPSDKNAPFVYVNGTLSTAYALSNCPFKNIDVIADKVTLSHKFTFDAGSTIYCTEFTSNCGSNSKYDGDIYVDGDVYIYNDNDTKVTWAGSPVATPTVVHGGSGTIHFTGKVIEGSTGTDVTSGATTGFAKDITSFKNNLPKKVDVVKTGDIPDGKENAIIEIQLPDRTDKKQLETHSDNYNQYYVKDSDGKLVTSGSPPVPEKISAQTMADIDTMGDKSLPFISSNTGITDKLSAKDPSDASKYKYPAGSEYGLNFNHIIDTGGGEVKCIWDEAGANDTYLRIKGGGTVTLQLRDSGGYNNGLILVDDDTTLKIVGDVDALGSGDDFDKLEVYNQTTYGAYKKLDAGKGVNPLCVGSAAGTGIKVPKIYYYFTGSELKVKTNCLLTGYIYAPDTVIKFPAAGQSKPDPLGDGKGLLYNGTVITDSNVKVCVIGSVLVKGADIPNMQGIAYINPNLSDDGDAGDPIHQWQAYQYTRN